MDRRLLAAAAAAALLAGCTARDARPAARADPPFAFPHGPHVEGDVDCLLCHASIAKATALEARVRHVALPKKLQEPCSGCHETLPRLAPSPRTREFDVRMDHAAHLARPGVKCTSCHAELPDTGQAVPPPVSMNACTACHVHQKAFAEARCTPCHVDMRKLEKPLQAFAHQGDWPRLHGQLARPSAETCAQCHDQTFCADCHAATTAPGKPSLIFPEELKRDFIHRGDFVSRHMFEADASPASCRRCHGSQFCDACHTQQNWTQRSAVTPHNNPHPQGWGTPPSPGAKPRHAAAARANVVACAGCHDHGADSICVQCHRQGGIASDPVARPNGPHPSSFVRRHQGDDKAKNAMCLACHVLP
jgi:hypothetical protein